MNVRRLIVLLVCLTLFSPVGVFAEEIAIVGNGGGSDNSVDVVVNQAADTLQANTGNVANDLTLNSNTGQNQIVDSSGDSGIVTGNAANKVVVNNEINSNVSETVCCVVTEKDVIIQGNGEESANNVAFSDESNSQITQINTAIIRTNINGTVNTGNNSISGNGGEAALETGDIFVSSVVINGPVNSSKSFSSSPAVGANVLVSDNGSESSNKISLLQKTNNLTRVVNNSDLLNEINWGLNTGFNFIDGNLGLSIIKTGDIYAKLAVINNPINSSFSTVDCDCFIGGPEDPGVPENPGDPCKTTEAVCPEDEEKDSNDNSDSDTSEDSSESESEESVGGYTPPILGLSFTGIESSKITSFLFLISLFLLVIGQTMFISFRNEE